MRRVIPSFSGRAFLIAILISLSIFSYAGENDNAFFALDFQTTNEDTQTASIIDATPIFQTVQVDGESRIRFSATVVLKDATNLIGVNCDLLFDKSKIQIVEVHEIQGDLNFDGRANVADVLTLAERYGQSTDSNEYSYFDRDSSGDSAQKIDNQDIEALLPFINQNTIYWTSNPNADLTRDPVKIRESVEIFESPEISNANGKIDDLVVVLLPRIHPTPEGFGFDGDARIAEIVFEVVPGASGETTLSFEDTMAIDEATQITQTDIVDGSVPKFQNVVITLP